MFVTALLAASLAVPEPKGEPTKLYFSIEVGTKRVMERKSGKQTSETTETITKVEVKDGVYTITLERSSWGFGSSATVFTASGKGVWVNHPDQVPLPLLKQPAKEGDTWTYETGSGDDIQKTTYTVGKEEEVTITAGKFTAIRVDSVRPLGRGRALKFVTWFAPGVGIVKEGVTGIDGVETMSELKEFTLGKAKDEKKDK